MALIRLESSNGSFDVGRVDRVGVEEGDHEPRDDVMHGGMSISTPPSTVPALFSTMRRFRSASRILSVCLMAVAASRQSRSDVPHPR